jgi:hypothetical protein
LKRDAASATGTEWLEIEENRFAAALLMPKHILVELLTASPIDIDDEGPLEDLSKKFNVSKAALQFRIRNLLGELATKRRAWFLPRILRARVFGALSARHQRPVRFPTKAGHSLLPQRLLPKP